MFLEGLGGPGRQVGAASGGQQVMRCSPPAPAGGGLWHGGPQFAPGWWICLSPVVTLVLVSWSSQCKSAF